MSDQYSIWLLPAASDESRLQATIARLAEQLAGARFAPHVTIQGDIRLPLERLSGSLDALAGQVSVQRWRVQDVETSEHFYRCLYLRFAAEPAFARLQREVRAITGTDDGLSPFTHLSLAYGQPRSEIDTLRTQLITEFSGQGIVFDRLAISLSSQGLPIDAWSVLAERTLVRE